MMRTTFARSRIRLPSLGNRHSLNPTLEQGLEVNNLPKRRAKRRGGT
jgi:hypothetical protein